MMLCQFIALGLPYVPGAGDLRPFSAELWLVATLVALLLTPFFVPRPNFACAAVSFAGISVALLSLLLAGPGVADAGRFGSMLVNDPVALFFKALLLIFVLGIILLWLVSSGGSFPPHDGPEFFTLLIGATLGLAFMASAANLLMVFLAVEMASLPSYVLAGFRKTHRLGAEASLKYVLFGAAASAVMVYGLSMFYGLYGTLTLYPVTLPDGSTLPGLAQLVAAGGGPSPALQVIALGGLIVGAGFKIAAVPFHFWCPDVFEGASVDVTAFLSVASKGAGLVLLLRLVMAMAEAHGYATGGPLAGLAGTIGALGALTATVGNTAAYVQNNIKRLLAYSSIAHAGYMLCALSLLSLPVGRESNAAPAAILIYLAVYLFMNLGAFVVAAAVWNQTGSEDLSAWKGLGRRSPLLAGCMFIFVASLIGLPPLGGFVAKLYLLWALIANGGWWWLLAGVVVANTVISAFYYFRIVRAMYLEHGDEDQSPTAGHPLAAGLALSCAVMLVATFVGFGTLSSLASRYGRLQPAGTATAMPAAARASAAPAD